MDDRWQNVERGKGVKNFKQRTKCDPTWSTPDGLFDNLNKEFGFTLDVCASKENAKTKRFLGNGTCGLLEDWGQEICWMNPPYGRAIPLWVEKAYRASGKGATVVCLLPSRTCTAWFHDYAIKGEMRFLRGRLKFKGAKHNAPFPSMLVIFRPTNHNRRLP